MKICTKFEFNQLERKLKLSDEDSHWTTSYQVTSKAVQHKPNVVRTEPLPLGARPWFVSWSSEGGRKTVDVRVDREMPT